MTSLRLYKGDNVRRTYKIANCKKYRIKSLYDNKIDVELGTSKSKKGPQAFISPAISGHMKTYEQIINKELAAYGAKMSKEK